MEFNNNLKITSSFKKWYFVMAVLLIGITLSGCKKFVEIDPPVTEISAATVYNSNSSAAAVMTGVYSSMMQNPTLSDGQSSIGYLQGLASDELTNYTTDPILSQFYTNSLSSSTSGSTNYYYWQELYNELHVVNAVIEGLSNSKGVTANMQQQLTGEAKFMRAFLHFYAVNLYGDAPLITTTNYLVNNQIGRTPTIQVYQQIIQDLKDAQSALTDNFVDPSGVKTIERIRPNKGAATALLARVYLYLGDWKNAEAQASTIISNANYSLIADLNQVFKANSQEAIWQLAPVNNGNGYNTFDAYDFVLTSPPGTGQYYVALSSYLLNAFETGDKRFSNWVGSYTSNGQTWFYPFKYQVYQQYQPLTEYLMVLRLSEQYLIRAEAEAENNESGNAITDLNAIRTRAGLPPATVTTSSTKNQLVAAIMHERQVELFTEWGHRWFDLKRTGSLDAVMGSPANICSAKGGTWKPDWALLPLPLGDLQIDPKLTQNPGY